MAENTAKLKQVVSLLAGKNCGKCGYPNCGKFAVELVEGKASPLDCRNSRGNLGAICQALGIEVPQPASSPVGPEGVSESGRHGHDGHHHHHAASGEQRDRQRDGHSGRHDGQHQGNSGHHGRRRFLSLF